MYRYRAMRPGPRARRRTRSGQIELRGEIRERYRIGESVRDRVGVRSGTSDRAPRWIFDRVVIGYAVRLSYRVTSVDSEMSVCEL